MARPRRDTRDIDAWFNDLYELFLQRWHPAIAAMEAELEARRHCRRVTR